MEKTEYRKIISTTIANLRFPLLATVILSHCRITGCGYETAENVSHLISHVFTRSSVELFFLMSGFLYFWNIQKMDWNVYKNKTKSRFWSLVVPYVFWNTFMIACYAAMHAFTPNLINPENENVLQYGLRDWIMAYWNKAGGYPVCYPLWFLRNLIVITLCSPILYLCLKMTKFFHWGVLIILIIVADVFHIGNVLGLSYFYLGALLSLNDTEDWIINHIIVPYNTNKRTSILFKSILAAIFAVYCVSVYNQFYCINTPVWEPIHRGTAVILFSLLFISISKKKGRIFAKLSETGYFIYLFHAFPVFCIKKFSEMLFHPSSSCTWIITYFCQIVFTFLFCIFIYKVLMKIAPTFTNFVTGNKKK